MMLVNKGALSLRSRMITPTVDIRVIYIRLSGGLSTNTYSVYTVCLQDLLHFSIYLLLFIHLLFLHV